MIIIKIALSLEFFVCSDETMSSMSFALIIFFDNGTCVCVFLFGLQMFTEWVAWQPCEKGSVNNHESRL